MRISDWSSDVCSSDLRECIRGKQAGKLQCCLQSRLLVEAPEPEFLREPLPTLDDFEVVLRPQYSDRVPGLGIAAATQPNASDEYLRWLAARRSVHRTEAWPRCPNSWRGADSPLRGSRSLQSQSWQTLGIFAVS